MCVKKRERERERERERKRERESGTKYGRFAIEYVYDCSMRTERIVHKNAGAGGAVIVLANNR